MTTTLGLDEQVVVGNRRFSCRRFFMEDNLQTLKDTGATDSNLSKKNVNEYFKYCQQ